MSDNVMYDSPTEFLHDVAGAGACVAQSVIPRDEGGYVCACSCERWEVVATSREEGLRLAREHTGSSAE
ncbi:hypothetical protein [Streptomyces fuscichromogenes]|uniref:Uncharacterized protein n=1 Tax=Streptomyces fuscichromogenes TaxID=1324013 RepID=A0A917XMC6_9ACTN|nr:hypothetical protein [Streptomyces fuscichromogenes]GGN39256.1 hypothetical protein GCM10011578_085540 [Streptomyces fuscichromogenes]